MHDLRRAHEGLTQALRLPSKHFSGETWSVMKYKTTAKLVIQACEKDLPGVFGHGCVLLLQGIAREHSLNRAAKSMGMAYSKAWRIVNEAEGQLGCKLIERDGARGSTLTPAGERAIAVYEELQTDINNAIATKANALIASIKE